MDWRAICVREHARRDRRRASNLIDELRQQYVLAIEAANGGEWRRLDVRVRRPSTMVKARSGYFAGASATLE